MFAGHSRVELIKNIRVQYNEAKSSSFMPPRRAAAHSPRCVLLHARQYVRV